MGDTGAIVAYYPDDGGWRVQERIEREDGESGDEFQERLLAVGESMNEVLMDERPELAKKTQRHIHG